LRRTLWGGLLQLLCHKVNKHGDSAQGIPDVVRHPGGQFTEQRKVRVTPPFVLDASALGQVTNEPV
jgi:hypothetical protein